MRELQGLLGLVFLVHALVAVGALLAKDIPSAEQYTLNAAVTMGAIYLLRALAP